jgi:hypothetical protein
MRAPLPRFCRRLVIRWGRPRHSRRQPTTGGSDDEQDIRPHRRRPGGDPRRGSGWLFAASDEVAGDRRHSPAERDSHAGHPPHRAHRSPPTSGPARGFGHAACQRRRGSCARSEAHRQDRSQRTCRGQQRQLGGRDARGHHAHERFPRDFRVVQRRLWLGFGPSHHSHERGARSQRVAGRGWQAGHDAHQRERWIGTGARISSGQEPNEPRRQRTRGW